VSALRLDRLLANMGYGSRKEVQALVAHGAIELDGVAVKKSDERMVLTPDLQQRLVVDGEALDPLPGLTLMLHKPVGMTCSHKEAGALVYDVLPERWRRREPPISTVGRLDKETSGLLLMTDDGGLLHRIISPKKQVAKYYRVTLDRPLEGDEADIFAGGHLRLEGETTPLLPAKLIVEGTHQATVILTEGRYHQVRRMFAAVGNHVVGLHRDRVGGLELPKELAAGEFIILPNAEEKIFSA
jgi:16S rRNA pseudouridine516 synthase